MFRQGVKDNLGIFRMPKTHAFFAAVFFFGAQLNFTETTNPSGKDSSCGRHERLWDCRPELTL